MDCSCFYVHRGCFTHCQRDISDHVYSMVVCPCEAYSLHSTVM
jgi:hypothetical protein